MTLSGAQASAGVQVVQIFDSWAHHLSPADFAVFSMPYAQRIVREVAAQRPGVPLIFHANGGGPALSGLVVAAPVLACIGCSQPASAVAASLHSGHCCQEHGGAPATHAGPKHCEGVPAALQPSC